MQTILKLPKSAIFTGCTHLDHKQPFIWQARGFNSPEEHAEWVVREIASYYKENPNTVLIHLGDGFLNSTPERAMAYFGALGLPIYYIWGNHESPTSRIYKDAIGDVYIVYPTQVKNVTFLGHQAFFSVEGQVIFGSHFPHLLWDKAHDGFWHIHSHNHGALKESSREYIHAKRLDVGVDNNKKYFNKPYITFPQLKEIMGKKNYVVLDHHGN